MSLTERNLIQNNASLLLILSRVIYTKRTFTSVCVIPALSDTTSKMKVFGTSVFPSNLNPIFNSNLLAKFSYLRDPRLKQCHLRLHLVSRGL
jgi:hypothetical protein